jgi:3-deoxy-D-manno-octulosonic-acid transferase
VYWFVYNIFLLLGLTILFPFLLVKIIISPKYKGRILRRLGKGLKKQVGEFTGKGPRIWIHALSVGEAASARSLLSGLRRLYPEATIVFSATTRSGEEYSRRTLREWIDLFVPFPLDLVWTEKKFIKLINPDLFILIETDFWPNFLHELAKRKIPAILINGRISTKSYRNYKRFWFFFKPMFSSFRFLAMQTGRDVDKFVSLGLDPNRVAALGNLKYDTLVADIRKQGRALSRTESGIPLDKIVWIAGSIHKGEEGIIFRVFVRLLKKFADLYLIIAPRELAMADDLLEIAKKKGLKARLRTNLSGPGDDRIMILNTMGELAGFYGLADLAFVGGSLVAEGGHNPLEPAAHARPVVFGPYMEDFGEISNDLLMARACMPIADEEELATAVEKLIVDKSLRKEMGRRGADFVGKQQGVTGKHLQLVRRILADSHDRKVSTG